MNARSRVRETEIVLGHHCQRVFAAGAALVASRLWLENGRWAEGHVPEALNLPAHASNLTTSALVGMGASIIMGDLYATERNIAESHGRKLGTRVSMIASAALAGAALNSFIEWKIGAKVFDQVVNHVTTPDRLDLVYGMAGATAGGALAMSVEVLPVMQTAELPSPAEQPMPDNVIPLVTPKEAA